MIAALLTLLLGAGGPTSQLNENIWLIIGASDPSPAGMATKVKALSTSSKSGLIMQTSDCGDAKNVFGWAAEIADSAAAAQEALARVRGSIKSAYVKRCHVRARSLLALRVPAVDASIADVPQSAVNWGDEDRVSSVIQLPDGRSLVVSRYFLSDANDPLEGRRERVLLFDTADKKSLLVEDCPSAGAATANKHLLAFQCAREQAADQLLHSVMVFNDDGKLLVEISHCRDPSWNSAGGVRCSEETVGADGRLKLSAKLVPLQASAGSNDTR